MSGYAIGIMSYSLNSLKGGHTGEYIGTSIGVIKGDIRSLDYSVYDYVVIVNNVHTGTLLIIAQTLR